MHICRIYLNLYAIHNCQSHENFVFSDQTASQESSHGLIFLLLFFLFSGFGCVCLGKLNEKTLTTLVRSFSCVDGNMTL